MAVQNLPTTQSNTEEAENRFNRTNENRNLHAPQQIGSKNASNTKKHQDQE